MIVWHILMMPLGLMKLLLVQDLPQFAYLPSCLSLPLSSLCCASSALLEHFLSMHMTYISASFCMHGQLQQGLLLLLLLLCCCCCSALLPNCFFLSCLYFSAFLLPVWHVILQCEVFSFYAKALKYLLNAGAK